MNWYSLPEDILRLIYDLLEPKDLISLERVSQRSFEVVQRTGWPALLPRYRLHASLTAPDPRTKRSAVLQHARTLDNIFNNSFRARQLGPAWRRGCRPVFHLDPSRLLVATGSRLQRYDISQGKAAASSEIRLLNRKESALDDITGLIKTSSGLIVSTISGTVKRITEDGIETARYSISHDPIEALATDGHKAFAADHEGRLSLFDPRSPWLPPTSISTHKRPWCAEFLGEQCVAVGVSGRQAIDLYKLTPAGLVPHDAISSVKRSAVYDIKSSQNSQILLSAWFDGHVRMHDLRSKDTIFDVADPWSDSSLYSCDYFGNGQIVAGAARHGMLHMWDPRMIRPGSRQGGWSVYAPGADESPVYKVKGDGGRIWGVTSHRAFVLSFDGEVVPSPPWKGVRDYATGYRHEDVTVKLFTSI